jgi:Small-conductance mechanosensitive channel
MLNNLSLGWNEISGLGIKFDPSAFIAAFVVLAVAWSLNKLSKKVVERTISKRSGHKHAEFTAKKATSYFIYSMAGFAILGVFGVPLSALSTFLGLIGLGLSFALRDTIANFIAGMMIMVNQLSRSETRSEPRARKVLSRI